MAYCHDCGAYAALDDAAMCGACRASWRPAGDRPGDLGSRAQPQPLADPQFAFQLRDPGLQAHRVTRVDDTAQPV